MVRHIPPTRLILLRTQRALAARFFSLRGRSSPTVRHARTLPLLACRAERRTTVGATISGAMVTFLLAMALAAAGMFPSPRHAAPRRAAPHPRACAGLTSQPPHVPRRGAAFRRSSPRLQPRLVPPRSLRHRPGSPPRSPAPRPAAGKAAPAREPVSDTAERPPCPFPPVDVSSQYGARDETCPVSTGGGGGGGAGRCNRLRPQRARAPQMMLSLEPGAIGGALRTGLGMLQAFAVASAGTEQPHPARWLPPPPPPHPLVLSGHAASLTPY